MLYFIYYLYLVPLIKKHFREMWGFSVLIKIHKIIPLFTLTNHYAFSHTISRFNTFFTISCFFVYWCHWANTIKKKIVSCSGSIYIVFSFFYLMTNDIHIRNHHPENDMHTSRWTSWSFSSLIQHSWYLHPKASENLGSITVQCNLGFWQV